MLTTLTKNDKLYLQQGLAKLLNETILQKEAIAKTIIQSDYSSEILLEYLCKRHKELTDLLNKINNA